MAYANNGPDWTECEADAPGATVIVEQLPPEGYTITTSVLFDQDGVPVRQYSFIEDAQ